MVVVQEDRRDADRFAMVALCDVVHRGEHRRAARPEMARARQPVEQRMRPCGARRGIGQPAADDRRGGRIHEVPVVDEAAALHEQREDRAALLARTGSACARSAFRTDAAVVFTLNASPPCV
jgi:hypothetical protein